MRRLYGWNDILVMPEDLLAWAWSAPMRDLAAKVEMSDVGLKKLLVACGLPLPQQAYWNKVHAGKPVPKPPPPPPRRPGEIGRVRLDPRFANVVTPAGPLPSNGPFASTAVPEDLDELRARELKALGRVGVPRTLEQPYRALIPLLKKEERRREKASERGWHWDAPKFDTPVGKRRLRILNAILLALAKCDHGGAVEDREGELEARAFVGDQYLGLHVGILGKHRTVRSSGYDRPAPDLPATTPLMVKVDSTFEGKGVETWQDDVDAALESKIASIAIGIIVAGEAKFRRSLLEAEEREARMLEEGKRKRLEKLAELNSQRLADLHRSGQLLRQAQDIRALVELVRGVMMDETATIQSDVLSAWERWALAEADRLDPVRSGQIMTHIREPTLD